MPAGPILLVEPDARARAELADALLVAGHLVFCAVDSVEAVGFLRSGITPRWIVFDCRRRRLELERFQAQRERDPELRGAPIVVLASHAREPARAGERLVATLRELVVTLLEKAS
jgi:CheY-like chemotaxis protein